MILKIFLALLLYTSSQSVNGYLCPDNFQVPNSSWPLTAATSGYPLTDYNLHIFTQFSTPCYGQVTSWKFLSRNAIINGLHLAIFRHIKREANQRTVKMVSDTYFNHFGAHQQASENTWLVTYRLRRPVSVQPGDMLGYFYDSTIKLAEQQSLVTSVVMEAAWSRIGPRTIVMAKRAEDICLSCELDYTNSIVTFEQPALMIFLNEKSKIVHRAPLSPRPVLVVQPPPRPQPLPTAVQQASLPTAVQQAPRPAPLPVVRQPSYRQTAPLPVVVQQSYRPPLPTAVQAIPAPSPLPAIVLQPRPPPAPPIAPTWNYPRYPTFRPQPVTQPPPSPMIRLPAVLSPVTATFPPQVDTTQRIRCTYQPLIPRSCQVPTVRYFYAQENGKCKGIVGCPSNLISDANNFNSLSDCEAVCVIRPNRIPSGTRIVGRGGPAQPNCNQTPEAPLMCRTPNTRYYFNSRDKVCAPFYGCPPDMTTSYNNFESFESCMAACKPSTSVVQAKAYNLRYRHRHRPFYR